MTKILTSQEQKKLLRIARDSIRRAVNKQPPSPIDLKSLPPALQKEGATFVTLTIGGQLRGCIGTLQASQPLALDVAEHAIAAALEDYRFPPVSPEELDLIEIEISRLTPAQPLDYESLQDLPKMLKPHIDGVVLRNGFQHATFLPQVWGKLPDPEEFLSHLCLKMGAPADEWRRHKLDVSLYQVEEFKEE